MELRVNEVLLPEQITFNYEELKQELAAKVSMYETLVYADEQIKEAKADRANLNNLKKALNDERIRREREYMQPFNDFKAKINEIISIIDKPVAVIDRQVKEYEEKQKQDKLEKINEYMKTAEEQLPENMYIPIDSKWLNASVSMKSIHETINAKVEQIKNDLATLSNLPEFGFEATEVYKSTLDINKAINEAKRMSDMAKAKAAHEAEMKARAEEQARLAAEAEAMPVTPIGQAVESIERQAFANCMNPPTEEPKQPAKEWVSFKCLLSVEDAQALGEFFRSRDITFEQI